MNKASTNSSTRISLRYKILIALLSLSIILIGGSYYAKVQIKRWLREQNYEVTIDSSYIGWKGWGLPNLTFKRIDIWNKDQKSGLHHICAEKVYLQPSFISFVKTYLRGYELLFSIQNLKINKHTENYIEIDDSHGTLINNKDVYIIKDLKLSPLRFGLTESYTTPPTNSEERQPISHLVLYEVNAEGEYKTSNQTAKLKIHVPPANLQMPEGRTYEIHANGGFRLVDTSHSKRQDILPVEGKINFTINQLSNFLNHLHQVRAISLLAANIGSIIGFFVERSLEDAVDLELNLQKNGAFIKGIKVYP